MAKKVIQMYDKYKSTTKIYPKVIKECFQEDAQEYIEGQVVANPELAGTEGSLTSLEVGGTKYKVEQPINVEANPTLAGTEADLTGIQIGETKYKVGGGSQLYQHNLNLKSTDYKTIINFKIINGTSNEMTLANVNGFLNEKGFTLGSDYRYEASGTMDVSGSIKQIIGIQYNTANGDTCLLYSDDGVQINNKAISLITLKDKVYAL